MDFSVLVEGSRHGGEEKVMRDNSVSEELDKEKCEAIKDVLFPEDGGYGGLCVRAVWGGKREFVLWWRIQVGKVVRVMKL